MLFTTSFLIRLASYRLLFQAHRGEAPGEDEEHPGGPEADREGRLRQGLRDLHRDKFKEVGGRYDIQ